MKTKKRLFAALLALVLVLSCMGTLCVGAANTKNDAVRHQTCTALSAQAKAYYTGSYSFETLSALTGTATDSSVEAYGSDLYLALQELMSSTLTHTVTYNSLTSYWKTTDSAKGLSDAVLFYSDEQGSGYNREHVWPKSQGNFYQSGAGSDLHHLRPTNSTVNSARLHYTMGNVKAQFSESEYTTQSYNGRTVLWYVPQSDYTGNDCLGLVEVNDNIKGDVARILLYVWTTYGTASGNNLNLFTKTAASGSGNNANQGNKVIESLDTLLQWCEIDPVDEWEMRRNDLCQDVQGNRNVFIDYPEFSWTLFGRAIPDMDTPSGYAHDLNTASYTITAVSANPEMGSVSLTGRVITAQPQDGYYAVDCTVTPAGAAVVTRDGNKFTLSSLTQDCTATVTFAAKTAAAVSYSVPDGVTQSATATYLGDEIVLPTPSGTPTANAHSYTFLGWVASPVDNRTEKPTFYAAGSKYTATAVNATLYALYSYRIEDAGGKTDTFTRVTSDLDDFTGLYVVAEPDNGVMMNNDDSANKYLGFTAVTIRDNTITCTESTCIFTVTKLGNYYTVQDCDGRYLTCGGSKKIYFTEQDTVTASDTDLLWSLSAANGLAATNNRGYIQYNVSAPRFTNYSGGQKTGYLYLGGTPAVVYYTTILTSSGHTHSYEDVVTEPTCTEQGYTTHTCSCGDSYVDTYVEALGHDIVNHACTRCDYTEDCPSAAFDDLDTSRWYHEGIDFVLENGYMAGTDKGFQPDTALTREMLAQILYAKEGKPAVEITGRFPDEDTSRWYAAAIEWAAENGYIAGYGNGNFGVGDAVTREQIAVILYAYEGKPAVTDSTALDSYPDAGQVSGWAKTAMVWAVENGLITGNAKGELMPKAEATRATFAVIFRAYLMQN